MFGCPERMEGLFRQTDVLSASPIITETGTQSCSRQFAVGSIAKSAGGMLTYTHEQTHTKTHTHIHTHTHTHTHTHVPDFNTEKHFMNSLSGERCGQDILWPFSFCAELR